MKFILFSGVVLLISACPTKKIYGIEPSPVALYYGYVTQVHCKGRLLLSSIGNEKILTLQALPKDLGCGVILTPEAEGGRTDLLLKTSNGDTHMILDIRKPTNSVAASNLEIQIN